MKLVLKLNLQINLIDIKSGVQVVKLKYQEYLKEKEKKNMEVKQVKEVF
jgi:hypothetical protein